MNIEIQPIDRCNVRDAIDLATRVFGQDSHRDIAQEFNAAAGSSLDATRLQRQTGIVQPSYFLALADGAPAATTGYYRIGGHERDVWLGWTCVDEAFQGQRLGSRLMNDVFLAHDHGDRTRSLRIWTTTDDCYSAARGLYGKLGFIEEVYDATALDARRDIRVFSRHLDPVSAVKNAWARAAYPIDCEGAEIERMNRERGYASPLCPTSAKIGMSLRRS